MISNVLHIQFQPAEKELAAHLLSNKKCMQSVKHGHPILICNKKALKIP